MCQEDLPCCPNSSADPEKFDKESVVAKTVGGKTPEEAKVGLANIEAENDEVTVGMGGHDNLGQEEGEKSVKASNSPTPHIITTAHTTSLAPVT